MFFADYDADPLPKEFELHADNVETWNVFAAMCTQWNIQTGFSVSVKTNLKYEVLPAVMDLLAVKKKRRPQIFAELRAMETAALAVFAEKLKADQ